MTWCPAIFLAFNDKIKLDARRRNRINDAVARFRRFCACDEHLKIAQAGDIFLHGSVATNTIIKPSVGKGFDVDLVYPFNLNYFPSHATLPQIFNWFVSRLKRSDFYRNRLIILDQSVRIDYSGEFCVDVSPATPSLREHQPYAIPPKDCGSWVTDDPIGFTNWIAGIDARSSIIDREGVGRFVRCIRIMKRWRDTFFSQKNTPSSILLETILGKHDPTSAMRGSPLHEPCYPHNRTDLAYLFDMLRLTHRGLNVDRRLVFSHPTLPNEDLSLGWAPWHLNGFLKRLQVCIDEIALGINADSDAEAIVHYRKAFGETFPAV